MVGNPFYLVYVRKSRTFSCFELELELEQKPRTFRTRTSNSNAFDPTLAGQLIFRSVSRVRVCAYFTLPVPEVCFVL